MPLTKSLGGKKKRYDGERLWKAFHSMGRGASYDKLNKWAEEHKMGDPLNGGRVSQMGPNWAMWAWAMDFPEKAFPAYKKWALEYSAELLTSGIEPSDENLWKRFLQDIVDHNSKGKPIYSARRMNRFCEKYEISYRESEPEKVPV